MIWLNGENSPILEHIKNDLESELEKMVLILKKKIDH